MQAREALHTFPRPALPSALTAAAKHVQPEARHLVDEAADAVAVAGDGMIIQPALHNTSQPARRLA